MKMLKSYMIQMLAVVTFCTLILCFWDMEELVESQQRYEPANDNWTIEMNGAGSFYEELPDTIIGEDTVILKKKLNHIQGYADCIAFYSIHQLVDVYIEDEHVYKLYPPEGTTSKTPGNICNFIKITPDDVGKEIVIIIKNCYTYEEIALPDFYCGARDSIIMWHIKENVLSFLVSVILLLLGIVLIITYLGMHKTMLVNESLLWLGLFAIPLSIWSLLECQIITFFTDQILLVSQTTFAVLKLALIPVLQFVSIIFEMQKDKIIKLLCIVSMIEFWITSALQLLGILDYKQTCWITHSIFAISAIYVLGRTVWKLLKKQDLSQKSKQVILTHTLCVGIVAISVLMDISIYYTVGSMDSAKFSRMGFLIYIIVLALRLLSDSVQLIQAGKQVDTLRQEAETDVLTKLRNRRAFESALTAIQDSEMEYYGIVMCDLNNLKKFNDIYGHSIGDYYIIVSSERIQKLFGEYGTVYRIGGDEFCIIVSHISEEQVEVLRKELEQQLHEIGRSRFECCMEVAVGFAQFDRIRDKNLEDTMKRADASMYQRKEKMKGKISIR